MSRRVAISVMTMDGLDSVMDPRFGRAHGFVVTDVDASDGAMEIPNEARNVAHGAGIDERQGQGIASSLHLAQIGGFQFGRVGRGHYGHRLFQFLRGRRLAAQRKAVLPIGHVAVVERVPRPEAATAVAVGPQVDRAPAARRVEPHIVVGIGVLPRLVAGAGGDEEGVAVGRAGLEQAHLVHVAVQHEITRLAQRRLGIGSIEIVQPVKGMV